MKFKSITLAFFLLAAMITACKSDKEKAKDQLKEGMYLLRHSQFDDALNCFNKMIELTPNDDEAFLSRGSCWFNKGKFQQAFDDFKKASELNPNNAQAFYNKGESQQALGNVKAACPDWIKARDLGKPNIGDRIKVCRQWGFQ